MSVEKLNKNDLIAAIADEVKSSKAEAMKHFNGLINVIIDAVQKQKEISVSGVMTIAIKKRAARSGRHPQTGNTINIPEKKIVQIKVGKQLKDAVGA